MQANLARSYKRWQTGEQFEKVKAVLKHFFPTGSTGSGLNRRARVESMQLTEAVQKAVAASKGEADVRSVLLAVKCALPKEHSNGVRGVINLPESTSSDIRVLVIAPPDLVETALKSGAHIAGGAELIQDIIAGKLKFNRCISTPAMMPVLTKAARYLGPLGLMPTIKNGTLTTDISAAIRMAVSNVPFKIDRKAGVMHVKVGKLASFNQEMLQRNVEKVFEVISPFGASLKRGKFIESAHLCVPAEKALRFSPPLADKK